MKKQAYKILVIALILFFSLNSNAEENNPKLKSMNIARALAFDPLPADALFYAGKNTQGTINALIGGGAMAGMAYGFSQAAFCDNRNGDDGCKIVGILTGVGSAVPYLATLIWDGVGGVKGVNEHNKKVFQQKNNSLLRSFQPIVVMNEGTFFASAQFRF